MRKLKFRVVSATCRRVLSTQFNLRVFPLWLGAWMSAPLVSHAASSQRVLRELRSRRVKQPDRGGTGWTGNWTAPGNVTRADVVDTRAIHWTSHPRRAPINGARGLRSTVERSTKQPACRRPTLASAISQTFYLVTWCVITRAAWASGNNTFTLHLGQCTQTGTLNFGIRETRAEVMNSSCASGPAGLSAGEHGRTARHGTDYYWLPG